MTRLLPALAVSLLAGCATAGAEPESLVDHPVYEAFGGPLAWQVAIGDDIALRLGHGHFPEDEIGAVIYRFPRTLRRDGDGVRRWQSGDILIEARPGPCTSGVLTLADQVRVVHRDRVLTGCGGRPVRPERG